MTALLRPFWRYYGGKWRDAPHYPKPTHGLIIEPFAGAAGYSLRYPDRDVLLIDSSPIIAGIWRFLIASSRDDILSIPDIPDGGTVDDMDAPQAARDLAGFWCSDASSTPKKRSSGWTRRGPSVTQWGGWNYRSRQRVADQVDRIKHWRILEAAYSEAPDAAATWFIDPPYRGRAGRHYPHQPDSFPALGAWCRSRSGQTIVCEQAGADWLPFVPFRSSRAATGKHRPERSEEVIWINDHPTGSPQIPLVGGAA